MGELFARTRKAGALRPGLDVHDLSLIFEQLAALRAGDEARTHQLRRRYLALILDSMHEPGAGPLPGPAPTWDEINERWAAAAPEASGGEVGGGHHGAAGAAERAGGDSEADAVHAGHQDDVRWGAECIHWLTMPSGVP